MVDWHRHDYTTTPEEHDADHPDDQNREREGKDWQCGSGASDAAEPKGLACDVDGSFDHNPGGS
ncbi:MAG: hypothetical protein ACLTDS_16230 [Bianqueaceae bacterium]